MIRRDGVRRPVVALTPTYKGTELPAFAPVAPAGGWTPSAAWLASLEYADEHEDDSTPARLLTSAAYRALLGGVPGLHRADVLARLQGVDPRNAVEPEPAPF